MGCGHDAAAAPGRAVAGSAGGAVARSPASGQEAGACDRLQPRQGQEAGALSRADRRRPGHSGRVATGRRRAGRDRRDGGRAVARRGQSLSAADRAHHRPERAPGAQEPAPAKAGGEAVPAGEKLVSLFEPHADIIVKGGREVQYGHKLNLATGKSGLILDVVVEAGNPADAERFLPMLDRQIARRGRPPPMAAMPVATISNKPRRAACRMSPSTRSAASPLPTWSRAPGSIAGCATSAPGSRPASPASNAPMAEHAAPGAGSTISRPTSGPPSSPTT